MAGSTKTGNGYQPLVMVDTSDLPREEWLQYRRRGIGGSDVGAIFGVSPFRTCRDIYYDKLGIAVVLDDDSNWVQLEVGHLLEDLVAQIFHKKTGYPVYQIKKMFYHPKYPFMLADVDYFIKLPSGKTAILECKTTNYNARDNWFLDGEEIVPIYYELQGRHYLRRQMRESRMKSKEVLTTWSDYLSMAVRLGMDTQDEIVYRARKLKQRHDELVERCNQRKDLALRAGEILQKYPMVEENYHAVKQIYAHAGEEYTIIVPERIEDIILEGEKLHHCVGSSDRYWDRVQRKESYILFLRRSAEPEKAYYTLEIEPDGTVRQKRTMYDRQEEDIVEATKFLKKWQRVISERLTEHELTLARKSQVLRAQEFKDLRENQIIINTGELRGSKLVDVLMEDLLENQEVNAVAALPAAA